MRSIGIGDGLPHRSFSDWISPNVRFRTGIRITRDIAGEVTAGRVSPA